MADALVSPAVGGAMWAATAATTAYCARKIRAEADASKVPLMGVTGAFIFAAQMLNFTIPGTGSSGHLGGGLLLAILLGPQAAFLVMASVLTVQALFFADGGLLALGSNIFNLGLIPAFVAYPLYKRIVDGRLTRGRLAAGSMAGALVALTLGALGVVLETTLSGISSLPFSTFVTMMLPIHLAIGLIEGLVTAAVVTFVRQAQPEILTRAAASRALGGLTMRTVLVVLAVCALLSAGVVSWFASTDPDGLEWSIARVTGGLEPEGAGSRGHDDATSIQKRTALLSGYAVTGAGSDETAAESSATPSTVDAGTSVAGLVGGGLTLLLAAGAGLLLSRRSRGRRQRSES